jgi:hypothetical protein
MRRAFAAFEIAAILGLVLTVIWVVKPLGRPDLDLALRVVAGVLLLVSPWIHRETRGRLGLRLDTLGAATRKLLPVSSTTIAVAAGAGYYLMTWDLPGNPIGELAYYFLWATAQQFALQSVILLRLEDAGARRHAPLVAATLFSLVHAPNPGLMILTFLGGLLWCSTFRHHPNLFAVALSHAVLALAVEWTLPAEVTGGYRIGPAYVAR